MKIGGCPVCRGEVRVRREPVNDHRGEVMIYRGHTDAAGRVCPMGGQAAAMQAVAFAVAP